MNMSAIGFTDEPSSLQPGMTLGSLHIVRFMGKGAIGEVYLAEHEILGKQFALKVIPKGFSPEEAAEAFKRAARIQTKLDHPNIVKIDDLGEEELFYWMRMEYIEGERTADNISIRSLGDLMRHRRGSGRRRGGLLHVLSVAGAGSRPQRGGHPCCARAVQCDACGRRS